MASKSKNLAKHLGGKWMYDGVATWYCDDMLRNVSRCSPGVDQFDNPLPGKQYWLYKSSGTPERAEKYLVSLLKKTYFL